MEHTRSPRKHGEPWAAPHPEPNRIRIRRDLTVLRPLLLAVEAVAWATSKARQQP